MEAHRSISVSWSKFGRNISVELALDTKEENTQEIFLKYVVLNLIVLLNKHHLLMILLLNNLI